MDRREFIKSSSLFVLGLSFSGFINGAKALAQDAPAGKPACTDADPVAKALGYVPVAAQINKKQYPQFKTLKKDNNCVGCSLYTETAKGWGNCTMITNCSVNAKGLCGSWQQKAKKA